jgi:hypothetical protein
VQCMPWLIDTKPADMQDLTTDSLIATDKVDSP